MNDLRSSYKRSSRGGRGKTKGPRGVAWDCSRIEHLEPLIVRYDNTYVYVLGATVKKSQENNIVTAIGDVKERPEGFNPTYIENVKKYI